MNRKVTLTTYTYQAFYQNCPPLAPPQKKIISTDNALVSKHQVKMVYGHKHLGVIYQMVFYYHE